MSALFTDEALTQTVRDAIHAFALNSREELTREAHDVLEGVYGLHSNGTLEKPENLPALKDPDIRQTYERLKRFLKDEMQAGLGAEEAVTKLVKEIAFTHLNRLVAFKMLESSKLIREAVGRGVESNGFKFYLADHSDSEKLWKAGEVEKAYANFLRWQTGEIAREVPMLFDPDDLPSRLFPRLTALNQLLADLNSKELQPAWNAEETIGWIYQFFNERENSDVFDRLFKQKKKIRREDIPAATQRFTPRWIVRYLVENTLGRLWLQMHPDSRLGAEMRYLVPNAGEIPAEKLRPVKEVSLLDPACGTMHFGLVAFDLFAEMYREELQKAGTPGWLEQASVANEAEIPAAILAHNLFGIDIDLRATQLAALTLYIKAKRADRKSQLNVHNLACADVLPYSTADLARFLVEMRFTDPIFEKMLRRIREQLADIQQVGSLLRIEKELQNLVGEQRRKDERKRKSKYGDASEQPALLSVDEQTALDAEHYRILEAQLVQALDFFRQQLAGQGEDLRFFTGEASKSLRVLDLLLRRYDVVLANPPYLSRHNMNEVMAAFLDEHYLDAKGDLYAAFIARCAELTEEFGRVGMITQQSFMFISSYETLRTGLLDSFAIETMAHTGPHAFPEIQGEKVNTTAFILRREADPTCRTQNAGTYFRLVHEKDSDAKRDVLEQSLSELSKKSSTLPVCAYRLVQREFDTIKGSPWIYWLDVKTRKLFTELINLEAIAQPRQGLATASNPRFLRFWWEIGKSRIGIGIQNRDKAKTSGYKWFPISKGSKTMNWAGAEFEVINWANDGKELYTYAGSVIRSPEFYFRPGITLTRVGPSGFSARLNPTGQILDSSNSGSFPEKREEIISLLGILNSSCTSILLSAMNPTVNFQVGDLNNLPIPSLTNERTEKLRFLVTSTVFLVRSLVLRNELAIDFVAPLPWETGLQTSISFQDKKQRLEDEVNDEVYRLYNISPENRAVIEKELLNSGESEAQEDEQEPTEESKEVEITIGTDSQELAVRWISYAVGIVLGRFAPGLRNGIEHANTSGSATYFKEDFTLNSIPSPNEAEFNELVGMPKSFAYVDEQGGRHVFSREVEKALQALAIEDGISVLDEGHPRDLAARIEKALILMLGERGTTELIEALDGDTNSLRTYLREFLGRDYFTQWHFTNSWYRKRPIYWAIQSAKRSYGFIIFHEKITRDTFYAIQRPPYLDTKRQAVNNAIGDLRSELTQKQGAARKKAEKDLDKLEKLAAELEEFAKELEAITLGGYNHSPEWIDDGIILRMAPLWKVIPIWKSEPQKFWEQLKEGKFDWSHIAMNYFPERVKEKCKTALWD